MSDRSNITPVIVLVYYIASDIEDHGFPECSIPTSYRESGPSGVQGNASWTYLGDLIFILLLYMCILAYSINVYMYVRAQKSRIVATNVV